MQKMKKKSRWEKQRQFVKIYKEKHTVEREVKRREK